VKPPPFSYRAPRTPEEALDALAAGDAKVLAGGQSLIPLLNMRLAAPARLVDVNGLAMLDTVEATGDGVRIGALARHSRVERDARAAAAQPLLGRALRHVAHPVIRNRGTVVGSLAHGDPSAELSAVLAVLGGTLEVASARGRRTVPAGEFFTGPLETCLAEDEMVLSAFFPSAAPLTGTAFAETARRHGDYALVGVAAVVTLDDDLRVTTARAGYLSVAGVPVVLDLTEAAESAVRTDDWPAVAAYARDRPVPPPPGRCPHRTRHARRHARGAGTGVTMSAEGTGTEWTGAVGTGTEGTGTEETFEVALTVNGVRRTAHVPARRLLSDLLRHDLELTGTHVGCEHGVCGCCTILLDGEPVRSCLMLAVTASGHEVTTVEGLAEPDGTMSPVQQAFHECHGLQCGFCTPGFLCTVTALLRDNPHPTEDEVLEGISGNLCRCTGYQNIVTSILDAAGSMAGAGA
jgi:aerobic-type carbon monoxide dehydrogenase small subunit (CoxS/CutS family)/CO/xanthine dehydrogenase FAD-binding subunit